MNTPQLPTRFPTHSTDTRTIYTAPDGTRHATGITFMGGAIHTYVQRADGKCSKPRRHASLTDARDTLRDYGNRLVRNGYRRS